MNDSELLSILNNQISNATGGYTSSINSEKATALDYYYGDETLVESEDGESSIITREVLENVERELGQQLKVFAAGERVVQFDPVGAEDEDQADQETDYVNYVYNKQNNGFKITHDWIKTALLEKISYVKVYVEEEEEVETETYTGLNDAELAYVLEREGVEPIEHTEDIQMDEMGMPVILHDIKLQITNTERKIKVCFVPGEEIGVARSHNELSLKDCPFVYHKPQGMTASELIEMGIDKAIVDELPSYTDYANELDTARDDNEDSSLHDHADDSTREIEVYECYIRLDNGKGVSELRRILKSGDKILDNELCDFIPFATLCPMPMPAKHIGLGYADLIMDIQDVKSVLMQQILTNLYFTNMPELTAVEGQVNYDDLLYRRSGSVKRQKQPGMIDTITVPFTAGASIPMLEVLDSMIEQRVGRSQALDPNVLAKTTGMAYAIGQEQASALSEKLARTFAETGFKELFGMIHELAIKNIDRPQIIRMRGEYVQVDPTEWKHRSNMSVVVGLGTGNRDAEIAKLFTLADKQEEHLINGSPLVTPKHLYNTYVRIIERSGLKEPAIYFQDPEDAEMQPPKTDPTLEMQQALLQIEAEKNQVARERTQLDAQKAEMDLFKKQQDAHIQQMQFWEKLRADMEKHNDNLAAKLTDLELKYGANVPGSSV